MGKMTVDKRSHSETKGKQGSVSSSNDVIGRELLMPDEVRKLNGMTQYRMVFSLPTVSMSISSSDNRSRITSFPITHAVQKYQFYYYYPEHGTD